MEDHQERLRLALITSSPERWLPVFYPSEYVEREAVTEEDLDEDEGITYEFEDMDLSVAEELLSQLGGSVKQGSVSMSGEGVWR